MHLPRPSPPAPRALGALPPAALAALVLAACAPGEADRRPDVVLISIDTLRADHLGCYGYERDTSPFLDSFADEAVLFERNTGPGGGTLAIHMSMMTSLYPRVHGLRPGATLENKLDQRLEDERTTLAEVLRDAGYRTAAFTDSGWMSGRFGFDQGCDTFDDQGGGLEEILPKAREWLLANQGDAPLFLFVHTYDVHSGWGELPYSAPGDYDKLFLDSDPLPGGWCHEDQCASRFLLWLNGRARDGSADPRELLGPRRLETLVDLYDGGIRYVDDQLKAFFEFLKGLGLYEDSLVVVTSDHGEEFLEHGLFLHGQEYSETAFVPLLIRFPGARYAGRRIEPLVSTVDLMPTLLDGLGLPASLQAQGTSLIPLVEEREAHREAYHGRWVLRDDDWCYVADTGELFRTSEDPDERTDVSELHPEVCARMDADFRDRIRRDLGLLREFRRTVRPAPRSEVPEELLRHLEELGYAGADGAEPPSDE